jgi:release factor glutamine methyltransferase
MANVPDSASVAALLALACAQGANRLDAEVLLAGVLRCSRSQLAAHPERVVDALSQALFIASIDRRAAGEPVAYITGTKEFWSLPLVVSPDVLIPRPETELLVELCLAHFDASPKRVVDLGTGSGAIALALAKERPQWQVIACDASAAALEIARVNAQRLKLPNIEFRLGHWCDALQGERVQAIVSNPPYVDPSDPALLKLSHEPRGALVAEQHGFADLYAIARSAQSCLHAGGLLMLEHGASQAAQLGSFLSMSGYIDVCCHPDLAGLDRVSIARWP